MTRRSGSPLRAHPLAGRTLGPRQAGQRDAGDVPELLKPSVHWYGSRWDAARRRQSSAEEQCKRIDGRLGRLLASLRQHDESAQLLARELALVPDTRRRVDALRAQADELRPVLAALEQLYAGLESSSVGWMPALAAREADFRHARSAHYRDLQASMDAQLAELRHDSVAMRAAAAERSFQRDLENYHLQQQQPRARAARALAREQRGLHDVVLAPSAWAGGTEDAAGFFSDDDGDKGGAGLGAAPRKSTAQARPPPLLADSAYLLLHSINTR
ncbi:hypothetical protein GGI04_000731 [Coemansia thaxteri]|uniref:Uncharacterized protein n=1 Tax=Coemansia thaxteri TaxID=2663907 RepID=A0A9W8BFH8_9FUNG|nr:hypothetical protein H4R26_004805 [Coemansia thaxteri]KAJ2009087.1 hypothetical protein GGI04_000731 [Coemansia thaxteri]